MHGGLGKIAVIVKIAYPIMFKTICPSHKNKVNNHGI